MQSIPVSVHALIQTCIQPHTLLPNTNLYPASTHAQDGEFGTGTAHVLRSDLLYCRSLDMKIKVIEKGGRDTALLSLATVADWQTPK